MRKRKRVLAGPWEEREPLDLGKQPSRKQRAILDWIVAFTEERHYSPTFKEIGEAFNLSSPATVWKYVTALERKGLLQRGPSNAKRGLIVGGAK